MSALIWKPVAVGLLLAALATGFGWWLAARGRDAARVELVAERALSAECQVAIREQNRAVEALAKAKGEAEVRGQAAQQLAAANGKRFDLAIAQAAGARATTCAEAMPTVNAILEAIR